MDKKNTTIGIALLAAAIALFLYSNNEAQKVAEHNRRLAALKTPAVPAATAPATATPAAAMPAPAPADARPLAAEELVTLANDTVRYTLTTRGGAVKTVALLHHAEKLGQDAKSHPVLLNEYGAAPALALAFPDATGTPATWLADHRIVTKTATSVTFEATRPDGITVTREYALGVKDRDGKDRDPHLLAAKIRFRRTAGVAAPVLAAVNLGTLPPIAADAAHQFLNASVYTGDDYEKFGVDKFKDSPGVLGFGAHRAVPSQTFTAAGTVRWAAVTNQHFAGIASFDATSQAFTTGLFTQPVKLPAAKFPEHTAGTPELTVTADAGLNLGTLAPGEERAVALTYYAGPKEYSRLAALGDSQDKVIQFMKFFGFISINWLCKLLVTALAALHWFTSLFGGAWAWGLAIVTLTCLIKAATWPLTGMQMRAAEKMKSVQPHMEKIKEKHQDNPQKMQQEMMKLYAEHKVNPFAGCLPILIQMPIFTGLYVAFQTCSELRHQSFLWIPDLSVADTIPLDFVPGWLHILPIAMGLAMFANMRLTPMTNTDPNQKMMFYMLMAMFPIICYGSPAGLTLYWTVNSLLTLLQTWLTKREQAAKAAANGPGSVEILPPTRGKSAKAKR